MNPLLNKLHTALLTVEHASKEGENRMEIVRM